MENESHIADEEPAAPALPAGAKQRIIAVTSGKGGVGKSNVAVNLGITLTRFGHRVMLVDADIGMANIDLLLGITPKYNITHLLSGKKELNDIMLNGPSGVKILPSSSSGKRATKIDDAQLKSLIKAIREKHELADLVFVDTAAGLSDNVLDFLVLADEVILITTPEPTSIRDPYGVVKALAQEREKPKLSLIVNMENDQYDAKHVVNTMELVTRQFFNIKLEQLGWINYDPLVSRAVRQQQPFTLLYPSSHASKAMHQIAGRFADFKVDFHNETGLRGLITRVKNFFS
jgi:flagellar biosynthesis protein FlhG